MDNSLATTYGLASQFALDTVAQVPADRWEAPALGVWSIRELVGHTNRGHTTVEDYLLRPQAPEPKGSSYFSEASIAERGRAAVAALGDDPAGAFAATSRRVVALVTETALDTPLGTPFGATTLGAYLPSRIAELTIHGLDLARVLGLETEVPGEALEESLSFVGRYSARREGATVLLALTGRGALPEGYSVY